MGKIDKLIDGGVKLGGDVADGIMGLIMRGATSAGKAPPATSAPRRTARGKPGKGPATASDIEAMLARGGLTPDDLASRYPSVGDPVLTTDPKTGKEYWAKGSSPESDAVSLARRRIQEDIARGDYEPFFDVSRREQTDRSFYDRPDITPGVVKAKEETNAKYRELYGNETARANLRGAFESAADDPGAYGFYWMKQLQDRFIDEFGPEQGARLFAERFADPMAATTGGADPTSNLLMAHYGNYLLKNDLPTPATNQAPYPIGGRFFAGNMGQFDKIVREGGGIGAQNPKRYNFSSNFLGFDDRATMDEQMMTVIGAPDSTGKVMLSPAGGTYGLAEEVAREEAARYGVLPETFQEVGWVGGKRAKDPSVRGKPMIENVNEALWRTSVLTGRPMEEILREALLRGQRPLYGAAGAAVGAGLLDAEPAQAAPLSPEEEMIQYLKSIEGR